MELGRRKTDDADQLFLAGLEKDVSEELGLPIDSTAVRAVAIARYAEENSQLALLSAYERINQLEAELEEMRTDPVTGLLTRKAWEKKVEPLVADIQANFGPNTKSLVPNAALLLIADTEDLHFINNRFGHLAGDEALVSSGEGVRTIADFMADLTRTRDRREDPLHPEHSRHKDILGRLGGDEFGAVMPFFKSTQHSPDDVARKVLERIKEGFGDISEGRPLVHWGYTLIAPGETKSLKDYCNEAEPKAFQSRPEKIKRTARKIGRRAVGRYSWSVI